MSHQTETAELRELRADGPPGLRDYSLTEAAELLRSYPIPPGIRNFSLAEAAELLRCFPRFLEDNLRRLPHQKLGAAVAFDLDEITEIKNLFRVRPKAAPEERTPRPLSLADITPARGRRA